MEHCSLPVYEELWQKSSEAFAKGVPELDPVLPDKVGDNRRGLTLVFRPSREVAQKLTDFLASLNAVCPHQYLYKPEELHVTVLSMFTMTEEWEKHMRLLDTFRTIVTDVLTGQKSFNIRFRGVTASPGVVMIQGFPVGEELQKIREALRERFASRGMSEYLDRRYKITAAHISAMRFCAARPVTDWQRLGKILSQNRDTDFGEMTVSRFTMIFGDWYSSSDLVKEVETYLLVS
jgi:2'-5' RNA ligase